MIPEELAKFIGVTGTPITMQIEEGAIRRYAEAIDDPNPLYCDSNYARNSKYNAIICPPGFFGWPITKGALLTGSGAIAGPIVDFIGALGKAGFQTILDGGIEFEFVLPIRAGDTLVLTPQIINLHEQKTKMGKTLFGTFESIYVNQNGETVAKARNTMICPS